MLASSIPAKFPIPFASGAGGSFVRPIPVASQILTNPGFASLTDGFPPLNFTPIGAGGVPPYGADMNGILFETTSWSQWYQAGGPIAYDATFSGQIGGYGAGAVIQSAIVPGKQWLSAADNNTTNPDAFGAGWSTPIGLPSGTPIPSFSATVLPNCVLANGLTVGNAGSGGTTGPTGLASAKTFFLFVALWTQFPQSTCTTQFNGATVARGANAAADWAAGRVITTPLMQGASLVGADTMGGTSTSRLSGVPVITGGVTVPGSFLGENLHSLTSGENGPHVHSSTLTDPTHSHSVTGSVFGGTAAGGSAGGGNDTVQQHAALGTAAAATGLVLNNASSGSGSGHNTVSLSYIVYWNLAL